MDKVVAPLILVDGSSYLYRAFHAMPSLMNSKGVHTGAIYGVINMLRRLLTDYSPERIAVVFDAKGKTFRDDLFAQYKANRPPMPAELAAQIPAIHAIITALGIPLMMEDGVEADDVIGTLAKAAEKQGMTVLISTGDKDMAQLVTQNVTLVNTMTDTFFTPVTVKEKFGILPEQIVDYLALVGDTADNIPGVPMVGPKTAVKWLTTYGSLDGIMQNASAITGKVGENLRANLSQIPLAHTLATIKLDVPLATTAAELVRQPENTEKLIALYREYEFRSWLKEKIEKQDHLEKQDQTAVNTVEQKYANYETIFTHAALDKWLARLMTAPVFAFDTETTSLNYMDAELVGMSFAVAPGEAMYIPLMHHDATAPTQLNREEVLQKCRPLLESKTLQKVGHHVKYDMEILAQYEISLSGILADTLLESAVLDSSSNNHGMDVLALKHLGWRTITFADVAGKGAKQITFDAVPIEAAARYAAEDADVTLQLHQLFWPKLVNEPQLKKVVEEIEVPLIPVLARIERHGVLIDTEKLAQQTAELQKRTAELEKEVFLLAGETFNMNSPKQLQTILYEKLACPVLQKTPTGQPSTAENVLQELAIDFPLPRLIIEYRGLSKLISTYTKRLPELINARTQRIHTSYHQMGAATGRLSSSDPNLQNIPIRTTEGRRIREAFIAPPGFKLMSADYSQIELRLMAHMSEDAALLKAFADDLDVHRATAAEVLGIALEKVTAEERRAAKAINFGLIYGMSAFGLAKQLGVGRDVAQAYIDRYFARYPGIKNYMERTRTQAYDKGYVETLWGRRLYLPDIRSSQMMRKKAAERTAINAPLQGSAADIIKRAMISLDNVICKKLAKEQFDKAPIKIIMQVHDELVLEVRDDLVEDMIAVTRQQMMAAANLRVPLSVNIGVGDNWDAASK